MAQHKIVLGDWQRLGHGMTGYDIVEIPDEFTSEILNDNYRRNVQETGVNPEKFADSEGDSLIPVEMVHSLLAKGMKLEDITYDYETEPSEDGEDVLVSYAHIADSGMLNVLMFLFGDGLEGFTWKVSSWEIPTLVGPGAAVSEVGYGLYYNED